MEPQRRRHKIDERRSVLQSNPLKIDVASDLSALQLPPYAQPIVRRFERQMNVLVGLPFNNRKPSRARHSQESENAVFSADIGKNLRFMQQALEKGAKRESVAAEALDGQREPMFGMVGYGEGAPCEVKVLRSEIEQRLLVAAAHFPGHSRKRRNAAAVLADFYESGGHRFLEAGLRFGSRFHSSITNEVRSCRNMSS